jgi:hypothetical protein
MTENASMEGDCCNNDAAAGQPRTVNGPVLGTSSRLLPVTSNVKLPDTVGIVLMFATVNVPEVVGVTVGTTATWKFTGSVITG